MTDNTTKEKISKLIESNAQLAGTTSKHSHEINQLRKDVDENEENIEAENKRMDEIYIKCVKVEEIVNNIKSGMNRVEKRFTITKIISLTIGVITVGFGMITTFLVVLEKLGIFDTIEKIITK